MIKNSPTVKFELISQMLADENNVMSVTIIADSSMTADALSTTAFALGIEQGLNLIESISGVEALYVTDEKQLYATSGFLDYFQLTDDTFTLVQ